MSMPGNSHPPPSPGTAGGKLLLLILLLVASLASVCCCGGIGGLLYWFRSTPLVRQMAAKLQGLPPPPPNSPNPPWVNDWVVNQVLTRHYTEAVDAIAANSQVIEALGEPIEPQELEEEGRLFQRQNTGQLNPSFEAFEFPIKGPRGSATVQAECLPFAGSGQFRLTRVIVTLADGRAIEAPAGAAAKSAAAEEAQPAQDANPPNDNNR